MKCTNVVTKCSDKKSVAEFSNLIGFYSNGLFMGTCMADVPYNLREATEGMTVYICLT